MTFRDSKPKPLSVVGRRRRREWIAVIAALLAVIGISLAVRNGLIDPQADKGTVTASPGS